MSNEINSSNFIRNIIINDLESGKHNEIITRFPPEPNGYLHIGHAKSILLNFGLAEEFHGKTHLRFDDTNPVKEDTEYVDAIKKDIEWLGYTPKTINYGSSYFDATYEKAVLLIKKNLAYVDDLDQETLSKYRGSINEPGIPSPYRNRTIEENLKLFEEMKNGKYANGEKTLRAKIDMASPNINLRDPVIYRIMHVYHHQTKDKWCIYPMYDFAHPLQDAFEGITHSLCSIEFEDHRPLYEWVIHHCDVAAQPRQIEWGRLGITNMIMSKRYLKQLVDEKYVSGYDDPRMPTLVGLRRRGFTPDAIRTFIELAGVSKAQSSVDYAMLEFCIRDDLKLKKSRVMAVLDPVKVVITNYPEGQIEYLDVENNKENEELGSRKVAFGRELYIERDDFMIDPPKKYFRMYPGNEVRLMNAYFVKCTDYITDENGKVTEIHCTYDPETKRGSGFTGRKVKGTIHWVCADECVDAEVRLYENIVDEEKGVYNEDGSLNLNPNSLTILPECKLEAGPKDSKAYDSFQFVRQGYFCCDAKDSSEEHLVFNRIVSLKSSYKPKK